MGEFLLIVLIVIGIWYINKTNNTINQLKKENEKLKKQLSNYINLKNNENQENSDVIQDESSKIPNVQNINSRQTILSRQTIPSRQTILSNSTKAEKRLLTEEEKIELRRKKELAERERKNTTVLITGAILIVLAAIVFLMSTWNTVSNIIKTVVLVLLIGVFFGASKIAKERFKLDKASNTFFYLAMAYIPICFLSCSIFGLFGNYFSINGDGKYTYLTITMVLTAGIYFINYKTRNSKILLAGSILSQICSLILFGFIFEENVLLTTIILLTYNIALILLTNKDLNVDMLKYFYNGIPCITGIFAIVELFSSSFYMFFILPLLMINFLLLYFKKKDNLQNAYLFNISLYAFGLYVTLLYRYSFDISNGIKFIISIVYAISAFVIEGILLRKEENLIKSSMVVSLISIGIIYLRTLVVETTFIKSYMVAGLETLLMLLVYMKSKEDGKNILSYLIPGTLILTVCHILRLLKVEYSIYIIASIIIFIIGELFRGKEFEVLNKRFLIISNINIAIVYMISAMNFFEEFKNDVFYFILLELVYIYCYFKNRNYAVFKYASYITISFILLTGIEFIGVSKDLEYLIPLITTIIVIIIEANCKQIIDNFSKVFISLLSVATYVSLLNFGETSCALIGFLFSIYLIYTNFKNNENKYLRIIPMAGFLVLMMNSNFDKEINTIFLLASTVAITLTSIYQKKFSLETIFSGVYLAVTLDYFNNDYIQELFFIIWAFANMYFMEEEKTKDIFKALTYLGVYLLYNTFISELAMDKLSCWNSIGITILAILYLRKIIIRYIKNIDTIEYLTYSIIYLFALMSYVSEMDGIVFVLFVVGLVMYSYVKKYGSLFIVSIFAILINAILLTREFWLAIPWWIYLLLVGGTLIGFAIKNESDDKKEKLKVGNVIKNLKEKIEQ